MSLTHHGSQGFQCSAPAVVNNRPRLSLTPERTQRVQQFGAQLICCFIGHVCRLARFLRSSQRDNSHIETLKKKITSQEDC